MLILHTATIANLHFWQFPYSLSNENRWYKDPRWWGVIVSIASVVVIIISIIIQNSDFSIHVNPKMGEVQQGSIISAEITVESKRGYKESVSLNASGQPSGVVVNFAIREAVPPFTSNVIIDVRSEVPVGSYTITITGAGADGKKHEVRYTLNVKPPPLPKIKITNPKEGDNVPGFITVSGIISGELPKGQYMWVVVNPHHHPGYWWPQEGRIEPWKGEWWVQARIGIGQEDIGKKFDIAVILVNKEDDRYYREYLRMGRITGDYPRIPLAASANIFDRITVTRI